ncbi:hypothetical protein C5167_049880 [Papaver somniferum]|uniref:Uncharacterized protein n=1 Tax=Papaver somniferum TaxID=3469 RepID=A0A4Y7KM28_PAPSO|nr:hypothetical protein C5167_049880 [Papaver somniferum]
MRLSNPFKIFANIKELNTQEMGRRIPCNISGNWWKPIGTKGGHSAAHIKCVQLSWIRKWRYKEIVGVKLLRLRIVAAIRYTIS